jgi:hypothetical protein
MPVLGRCPKARPDLNQRRPVMHESKKHTENREFALSMIVEALHLGEIGQCDALDLAFEANGNHGEWTDERVEELAAKLGVVSGLAKFLREVAVR